MSEEAIKLTSGKTKTICQLVRDLPSSHGCAPPAPGSSPRAVPTCQARTVHLRHRKLRNPDTGSATRTPPPSRPQKRARPAPNLHVERTAASSATWARGAAPSGTAGEAGLPAPARRAPLHLSELARCVCREASCPSPRTVSKIHGKGKMEPSRSSAVELDLEMQAFSTMK